MILQIDPNAPWWVHAAAGTALALHIGGGTLGLASGAAAVFARKGFPEALRGSAFLMVPTFGTLVLLVFWLLRVRLGKAWRRTLPA